MPHCVTIFSFLIVIRYCLSLCDPYFDFRAVYLICDYKKLNGYILLVSSAFRFHVVESVYERSNRSTTGVVFVWFCLVISPTSPFLNSSNMNSKTSSSGYLKRVITLTALRQVG